jgi:hypothetical protein
MMCPDCNEKELKVFNGKLIKRCIACSALYYRKLTALKNKEIREKEIENRARDRICKYCKKTFITTTANQKYCYNPCSPKQISLYKTNGYWMTDKKK